MTPVSSRIGEIAVEGDLSQADDDPDARQGLNLSGEVVAQLRISWGRGLSPGGAQRTTEAIQGGAA